MSPDAAQPSDAACCKLSKCNVIPKEARLIQPDGPHVPAPSQRFKDALMLTNQHSHSSHTSCRMRLADASISNRYPTGTIC